MAKGKVQSYENHARTVPVFHFVAFPIFFINVVWSAYRAFVSFSFESVLALLLAIALVLLFFYARVFALTVQDRVIRLEMTLRLRQLLPADLQSRVNDFTVAQLVSLRFASDQELPDLARKVLEEKLTDRKAIKQLIRHWQPDLLRA
jgi:cell division protein FtsL